MKHFFTKVSLPLCSLVLLSGCIDDNYDLANIDTTSQLSFKDLVIPVNLDAIKLDDIIEIKDDSDIKIVNVDGKDVYALSVEGKFNSDAININNFNSNIPSIQDASSSLKMISTGANMQVVYHIDDAEVQSIDIKAENIHSSIHSITSLNVKPMKFNMNMKLTSSSSSVKEFKFNTINFDFLKGLTLQNLPSNYSYNAKTGVLLVSNLTFQNGEANITVYATSIDFNNSQFKFNYASHEATVLDDVKIESAEAVATFGTGTSPIETLTLKIHTDIDRLEATALSGEIEYSLEGESLSIAPVNLSDLPDFLANDQTNLRLSNPQIYLSMNNPVADEKITISSGLELISNRNDKKIPFTLDAGEKITLTSKYGSGPYNFVISPKMPSTPLPDFAKNLQHVKFSSLGNILAGAGLPSEIEINLVNPQIPLQKVTDFELGRDYSGVDGSYEFLAPLAFAEGEPSSVIVYTNTFDDWGGDDLEKLIINHLSIEADVTTSVPLNAELSIVPLDRQGNRISDVTVTPVMLDANAQNQHINLSVEGTIKDLDGIRFEAVVKPAPDDTLAPSQTITLTNLKAKASGSYTTDF